MNKYFVELVKRDAEQNFKMGWVKDYRKIGCYLIFGDDISGGFIEFYHNSFFVVTHDSDGEHLLACYDSLPEAIKHLEKLLTKEV